MEWISLIATALGAIIAFSGTTLSDSLKSRREQSRSDLETQRRITVDFMLAVDGVHGLLRGVARQPIEGSQLSAAAQEAASGLYAPREQLLISVPPEIALAAEQAFHAMIAIRDAVSNGAKPDSISYQDAYNDYADAVWSLRQAARESFGVAALDLDKMHSVEADRRARKKLTSSGRRTADHE